MAENGKTEKDEKMRVKLYMLNAGRVWDDQGTGYVSSTFIEKTKNMFLLVKEENRNTVLLESKIQLNTAYQKQQETLIVWSEADSYDYALSFQNKAGCDEIWAQICQVQGKDPSVEVTQDILDQEDGDADDDRFDSVGSGHIGHHDDVVDRVSMSLPPCDLSRLDDIIEVFQASMATPIKREKLATLIENENYVPKLANLFRMSEDMEDIGSLHKLFTAFKTLFFLNKTPVFEAMFADDVIFDVIGAMEYDHTLPKPIKHREYLKTQTRLKQAIPIDNAELIQKIHQTYRVQYIQDAILPAPSVFEENLLSTLNSFIYFNKMEIVSVLQEDEKYLQTLFRQLVDDDTDDEARKDMVVFLKEFCSFSQNLAQQNREGFYKVLSKLGILNALEIILGMDDGAMKSLAVDIFSYIVEFSPSMVREFLIQESQKQEDEDLLINMVIEQMITDSDPELGGALQLMGIIRLLIDPENMTTTPQKNEKSEFLGFFYPHCMHVLTAPLLANTAGDKPSKDDYQTAQLLAHILELLMFCVEHHNYHIKTYMINKLFLKRILVLLKSRHAFLQLASLRLLRRTISLKDEFYNRHIIKFDLFKSVVDAFLANGEKYNLFNSAVLELFEFIKSEDIKSLTTYFIKNHYNHFESLSYVQTFKVLKQRYDQQQEKYSSTETTVDFMSSVPMKPDQSMDEDEEAWFDQDDDMDDLPSKLNPKLDFETYSPTGKFFSGKLQATNNTLVRSPMPHQNLSSMNHCNKTGSISFSLNLKDHQAFSGIGSKPDKPDTAESKTRTAESEEISNSILFSNSTSSPCASAPAMTSQESSLPVISSSASTTCKSIAKDSTVAGGLVAVKAKTPSLMGLVDYEDEDDDDEEGDASSSISDQGVERDVDKSSPNDPKTHASDVISPSDYDNASGDRVARDLKSDSQPSERHRIPDEGSNIHEGVPLSPPAKRPRLEI